ncbi:MAG: carbonic anhydrase [Proteobacteria bacterium]|nr:carbonic anhydrase [Pseudomonadota bacterium]
MNTTLEALKRLQQGNLRFVSGVTNIPAQIHLSKRKEMVASQHPFAIILGCSDSRVPAELVFDQGLGDLFVIRVAGNIVAPSQIGSVEFAAEMFGTKLVVVLGHSCCGAVSATLDELIQDKKVKSKNLRSIVDRVRLAIEPLLATELKNDPDTLMKQAVRANISASANHLRQGSKILENLVHKNKLLVVGAEYSLETGVVDFFDGIPVTEL